MAKKYLKQLRVAAKDVGRLQQSNEALKAEIEMLRAKAAEDALKAQEKLRLEMELRAQQEKAQELSRLVEELANTKAALEKEKALREDAENRLELANKNYTQQLALATKNSQSNSSNSNSNSSSNNKDKDLSNQLSSKQVEEFNQIKEELSKEKVMREALESEILRLRQLAVEREASSRNRSSSTDSQGAYYNNNNNSNNNNNNNVTLRSGVPKRRMSESSTGSVGRGSNDLGGPIRRGSGTNAKLGSIQQATIGEGKSSGKGWDDTWDDESDDSTPSVSRSIYSDDSSAPQQFRSKKSFSEVPIPQQYQRRLPNPVASSVHEKNLEAKKLIMTFEKNLELFKTRMKQTGIRAIVTEGQRIMNAETILKLNDGILTFSSPARRFTLFSTKIEINPIKIADIIECTQGVQYDAARGGVAPKDDSCYLTIAIQTSESRVRYVSLMLDTRDDRNSLVTGIRTLMSDIHVNATTEDIGQSSLTSQITSTSGAKPERRRSSFKEGVLAEAAASATANATTNAGTNSGTGTNTTTTSSESTAKDAPGRKIPHSAASRKGRRGSVGPGNNRTDLATPAAAETNSLVDDVAEVKRQLLVERSNYEKLMVQMLVLTNDLNEREDQLIAMKKREEAYLEQLASKDRMYEQDAMVRMQLGKRLEQVLMDKEEIKDELDDLKARLDSIMKGISK
eukprot:CAMPEP_0174819432 /NCGR_PEP_ID=MMETSP1107-20130205/2650_1 /TAXON_ID=36770 /ORGANISM="Paraphysomonas vestita, Strain GFlagA" /LENGTH=681 /DNA_ID=CAMNT_0016032889 /DNA_START=1494 /DNA_END=3539 /DNA_ORIENTATION=-